MPGRVAVHGAGVTDHLTGPGAGPVGGPHRHLGPTVAVVVVHLELGVVRPGPDVGTHVDTPQPGAVGPVRVEVHVAGHAVLSGDLLVAGLPLPDDLAVAVAIVGTGARVGRTV